MKKRTGNSATLLVIFAALTVCVAAKAQVEPAATGSSAKLDYDLGYSESAGFYANYPDVYQRGTVSGEIEYLNGKGHTPFSLMYSGGYIIGISGSDSGTGLFQHMMISQGYVTEHGSLNLSDQVSYYPQSPTTGFSGIPGIGDLPGLPGVPSEPVLSLNTRSFNDEAILNYSRSLTYDTTFNIAGNYTWLRFPNGGGLAINQVGVRPQVSWRLNALNSASVQYSYSRFNYLGSPFVMETQSVEPGYMRVWNRRFTTSVSAGPEWIQSNNDLVVPSTVGVAANASAAYSLRSMSASLDYFRSVSAGAGLQSQIGVHYNDVSANVFRKFGRDTTISVTASYLQTQGILQSGVTDAEMAGANATRRLGDFVTASAGYTAFQQTSSLTLPTGALHGISQVISFSIAYHPRETRIIVH